MFSKIKNYFLKTLKRHSQQEIFTRKRIRQTRVDEKVQVKQEMFAQQVHPDIVQKLGTEPIEFVEINQNHLCKIKHYLLL